MAYTLPLDGSGWAIITPSVDTTTIYVSDSTGDDANDGLSTGTAKKTIAAGAALLRDGYPDHLLLKRGDTFATGLGSWSIGGRSKTEPMVIGSYGTGARPKMNTNGGRMLLGATGIQYMVFKDLHAYCNERDPASPDFIDSVTENGFSPGQTWTGLYMENCLIEFFSNNVEAQDNSKNFNVSDFTVRRCIIRNAYRDSGLGHSQGLYSNYCDGLTLEENVFYHNGWNETATGAGKTVFNHNIYLNHQKNCVVRGNITAWTSQMGIKINAHDSGSGPGGQFLGDGYTIENNWFELAENDMKAEGHSSLSDHNLPYFSNFVCQNNLSTNCTGYGIIIKQAESGSADRNIWIDNDELDTVQPALELGGTRYMGAGYTADSNTVHDWVEPGRTWFVGDGNITPTNSRVNEADGAYSEGTWRSDTYATGLGYTDTHDMILAALAVDRDTWDTDLMAETIVLSAQTAFDLDGGSPPAGNPVTTSANECLSFMNLSDPGHMILPVPEGTIDNGQTFMMIGAHATGWVQEIINAVTSTYRRIISKLTSDLTGTVSHKVRKRRRRNRY